MRVGELNDEPRSIHYVPLGWRVSARPSRRIRPELVVGLAVLIAAAAARAAHVFGL